MYAVAAGRRNRMHRMRTARRSRVRDALRPRSSRPDIGVDCRRPKSVQARGMRPVGKGEGRPVAITASCWEALPSARGQRGGAPCPPATVARYVAVSRPRARGRCAHTELEHQFVEDFHLLGGQEPVTGIEQGAQRGMRLVNRCVDLAIELRAPLHDGIPIGRLSRAQAAHAQRRCQRKAWSLMMSVSLNF